MAMKLVRRLATVAAVTLGAAHLAIVPAQAGTISIGMTTWVGYGPLFLARDLGYYKDLGLTVDLQLIEEGSLYMAAMAAGKLDGAASTLDDLMKYRSPDLCFKYVAGLDESHGGDGIVSGTDVNSVADLKGKQVAMNEGSVSEFFFTILLKRQGLSLKDITVENMTADDAAAAFIAGRVPAAVTWEPNLTTVREQKKGKVLIDSSSVPGAIVDVLALRCQTIKDHPDDVAALIKGYYKAIEYVKSNPTQAYAIMAKAVGGYLQKPEDFASAAKGVRYFDRDRNIDFWGTEDKGQAKDLIGYANEIWGDDLHKLKAKGTYADLVDASYVTLKP